MYCLTSMCYVCLEQKHKSLIDINSPLSVNKNLIHILGYLPCNLAWLKTKRIILICEECCRRLRDTYHFLIMCDNNSAVLQSYMAKINTPSISTADSKAELCVFINNKQDDINRIKCEMKSEDEEVYTSESGPIIEATEDVFVNVNESFVKEEDTWKRDEVDDKEGPPMDNNSAESRDNETDTEVAVNSNTHDTDMNSGSSEVTSTQGHTTNKKELNTPATKSHKCVTCSKSFSKKSSLLEHARVHTGEKPYKCAICEKGFSYKSALVIHARIHTGEKPYICFVCKRCFIRNSSLVDHLRTHTGERPYECSKCKSRFSRKPNLVIHMRIHTGEKPYKCFRCEKGFSHRSDLVRHMRTHTSEKPYKCSKCEKCVSQKSDLVRHMRTHTGEKF